MNNESINNNSEVMLTTNDNPFNPFEQFTSWFLFDVEKGYDSCSYLARIAKFTDDMTEQERAAENARAIDEIISLNPLGIYKKVTASSYTSVEN